MEKRMQSRRVRKDRKPYKICKKMVKQHRHKFWKIKENV